MNGQFLLARRYLGVRKQRMVLTTLAIAFGVAMLFGMNAMLPSIMTAFRYNMITAAGKVDLNLSSVSNNPFDQAALALVEGVPGVGASTGILQHNIQMPASLGGLVDPITGSAAITLSGVDPESIQTVRKIQVSSGRFLQAGDTNQAVIGFHLAERMGLQEGDTLLIPSSQGTATLQVTGVLDQFSGATIDEVYVPLATAQQILNMPGQITTIDIFLLSGVDKNEVQRTLLQTMGGNFKVGAVEVGNELAAALTMGENIMWLFGIMALAMAAFIIFNTFRTMVAERMCDLGMLRAVGASRQTLMGMILLEALIQGIIGTAAGLVLGYLLAIGTLMGMEPMMQSFMQVNIGLPIIAPGNLFASILMGIAFTVGSSYLPSRLAMKVTPLEALRPLPHTVEKKRQAGRSIAGLALMVLGAAGLVTSDLAIATLGTLAFLVGLIMIAPLLVKPVADTFGRLISLVYTRQGNLAQGNLTRQPGRAAITASAMMIGLAVTIAMVGLITSVFDGFLKYLDKSLGSDYLLIPSSLVLGGGNLGAAPEFAGELASIDGVSGVTTLRLASSEADGNGIQVIGIDPQRFAEISGLEFTHGDEQAAYSVLEAKRTVIINGIYAATTSASIGDVITLSTPTGKKEYYVVGIGMDYLNAKLATGYISQKYLAEDFLVTSDVLIMADRADSAEAEKVYAAIQQVAERFPAFTLFDAQAFKESQENMFKTSMGFMYMLVIMLAIPGLIAMANTMGINVIERTREIGMLRAVGSTQKQVRQMIFAESVMLSILGTVMGIVVGLFMSAYMLKALVAGGFELQFFFPWLGILAVVVVGLGFGILAAMVPARQAARTVIVEALRYE